MYLDQSTSHVRFASYEYNPDETYDAGGDPYPGFTRQLDLVEREMGLKERDLEARMSASARSSRDSRASLSAQMSAEKNRLALARRQLEEIGIPELELKKWTSQKNYEIARMGTQLDYLNAYAQARQSPDMYWLADSFRQGYKALNNGIWGQNPSENAVSMATAPTPNGAPQPQSLATLVNDLTGGGSGSAPQAAQASDAGVAGGTATGAQGGTGDARTDAAVSTLLAMPPSPYEGLSAGDADTLRNIAGIYGRGLDKLPLNSIEGMTPAQRSIFLGGGARLGYSNPDALDAYQRRIFQQGNAAAA